MNKLACCAAISLLACGELPHDNPHDPQAPTDTQGRATLVGDVALEPAASTAPSRSAIHVSVAGHSWAADTDADGHFAISGVPVGTWAVQYTRSGWDDQIVSGIVVTLDDAGGEIPLPPVRLGVARGNVAGRVALEDELSAGGVSIALDGLDGAAFTDPEGRFVLAGVPVGTYALHATKTGFRAGEVGTVTVTPSGVTLLDALTLFIDPGAFSGQVLVSGAADSGGVTVRATGTTLNGSPWESTTTNRTDGSFLLSGLPGGTYTVSFERAGYAAAQRASTVRPGAVTDLEPVTLAPARGALTGVARLTGATDSSATLVTVRVDGASAPVASALTDAAGAWHLDAVAVGAYRLTYAHDGYVTQQDTITVLADQSRAAASVDLLPVPSTIRGRVLAEGLVAPGLSGTTVRVEGTTVSTATLSDGGYVLTGVAAGTHRLLFERIGYTGDPMSVALSPGGDVTVPDAALAIARGAIEGTVALAAGAVTGFPVESDRTGIVVTLSGAGLPVTTAVTDAQGRYRLERVPVSATGAAYTVTAARTGYAQVAPITVIAQPGQTATAAGATLAVSAGAISGVVKLWDNLGGAGDNADSTGVTVTVSGTAFNGAAWSATASTGTSGAFNAAALPAGTYDLTASSARRSCDALPRTTVAAGQASALAVTARCRDAVGPGAIALGVPKALLGAQPGYTHVPSVTVALTGTTDPTGNLQGYQITTGAAPSWTGVAVTPGSPAELSVSFTPDAAAHANQRVLVWARAVDWAGNAGPASAVDVIFDDAAPGVTAVTTPRPTVNATTTSVSLSGGTDPNFFQYEFRTLPCPGGGTACPFTQAASTFAVSIPADQKIDVEARAVDRAGNVGPTQTLSVASDLTPPRPPVMAPSYDPYRFPVRTARLDFFVQTPAYDPPSQTWDWHGIAALEVDTGQGFEAICSAPACSVGGAWNPCTCGCHDARVRCEGTTLTAIRADLPPHASAVTVGFRAVDLAGNVGPAATQLVFDDTAPRTVRTSPAAVSQPRIHDQLVTWKEGPQLWLKDLGPDRSGTGESCALPTGTIEAAPLGRDVVAYTNGTMLMVRTPNTSTGLLCTAPVDFPDVSTSTAVLLTGDRYRLVYFDTATREVVEKEGGGARIRIGSNGELPNTLTTLARTPSLLELGGRYVLANLTPASPGDPYSLRLIVGQPSGSFEPIVGQPSFTVVDLPVAAVSATLSRDGDGLAYQTRDARLWVRTPGPDGVLGSADDVTTELPAPHTVHAASLAMDGRHIVAVSPTDGPIAFWSGPDAVWGTADDEVGEPFLFAGQRAPTLADGLLAYATEHTVETVDLTQLRWAYPLFHGVPTLSPGKNALVSNRRDTLFWAEGDGVTVDALRFDGAHSTDGTSRTELAADGDNLFLFDAAYRPDAAGLFLSAAAPAPKTVFASGADEAVVGEGRAMVRSGGHDYILDPGSANLQDFTGAPLDLGAVADAGNFGITARQAIFPCQPGVLCVLTSNGRFGSEDLPNLQPLQYPSLPNNVTVTNVRAMRMDGKRMIVSADIPGTFLLDAGDDGLFGTSDRVRILSSRTLENSNQLAVAGDWAAFLDTGAPADDQVYVVHGLSGARKQVTASPGVKRYLTIDAAGRTHWMDALTSPPVIMQYLP